MTTKVQSTTEFANELAAKLKEPEVYINLSFLAVEICQYMEQFETMNGEDKKDMAITVARKVYKTFDQELNEEILNDFIDCIISISRGKYLINTISDKTEGFCSCLFQKQTTTTTNRQLDTRSIDEAERDLVSYFTDAQNYFNIALLITQTCEFMENKDTMTGQEKKSKALCIILNVLKSANQDDITEQMISDFIDVIIAISRGLYLTSQTIKKCASLCL